MLEYTILCVIAIFVVVYLDRKFETKVLHSIRYNKTRRRNFILAVCLQLIFDNITVWRGLWIFNHKELLGIFLPFIPLENLIFGVCLFLQTAIFYEKFKGHSS